MIARFAGSEETVPQDQEKSMTTRKSAQAKRLEAVEKPSGNNHPLAGAEMSGAEMVVQVLADEGVDTIFGYSGGAILPTYDAIFRHNESRPEERIELIVPANEQGAGFMAAGYARSSGKVGVFLVTSGPGATNAVTPIRDCQADSVPVVLICGQVPRAAIGTDAFQEAPIFNIMSSCAKHVFLLTDEDKIEETVRSAFEIARSGRPGPVVIDIPKDVQNHIGKYKGEGLLEFRGYDERRDALDAVKMTTSESKAFFDLFSKSERPLVYAGGGVNNAGAADELRDFAKRFGVPVVTTLMGIGGFDTTDELSLQMLGMHGTAFANYAVEDCDFLFAVGSRFDDRVAGQVKEFAPHAKIAHLDIDATEIGKVKSVDWSYVADAKKGLAELTKAGKNFKKDFGLWRAHVDELRKAHHLNFNQDSPYVQAEYVLQQMNEITGGEAIVTTGVGQHQMWAAQYIDFKHPRTWLTSGSMGTMGFGLPAAVGAQLANPGKLVIDVDGDGSIRMNLGELETLTNYDIPVKVLLLNNMGDGMVRQWQDLFFENRYSGTDKALHKKDFVKAAEADGFGFARRIEKNEEVREALEAFIAFEGPAFLEVMTDRHAHVYPMIGPGMGYKDMITGKYIESRKKTVRKKGKLPPGGSMF
jgi:acetolactate synthase-1/2/3 large subunit